jgi:serine/threonine protein phosphatase PrpC
MGELVKLVEASSFSYPKSVDRANEDAILPAFEVGGAIFLALADGVGGSSGGNVASHTAIDAIPVVLEIAALLMALANPNHLVN